MTRLLSSFQTRHISPSNFISKQIVEENTSYKNRMTMFQGCILGIILVYLKVCSAAVTILMDGSYHFSSYEPLLIECELNGSTTDIDFRLDSVIVVTCGPVFGCSRKDTAFNVSIAKSFTGYILHSVNNFDAATFCGVYQCTDTLSSQSDTVTVSYKNFNNDTFFVDEQDESLMISTTCVFPAMSEFITVTWFLYEESEKSLQQLSLTSATSDFGNVSKTTNCSNITCSSDQAKSFSFGLNFGNQTGRYDVAAVEIHIVHSLFEDKPLVWRSSKTYPVKDFVLARKSSDKRENAAFSVLVIPICVAVFYIKLIKVLSLTLFFFIKGKKKIADNMTFELKAKEALIKLEGESFFYILLDGEIEVVLDSTQGKTITVGDGFGRLDLVYGIAENDVIMNSEITVKKDKSDTAVKIHALSSSYVIKTKGVVLLLKMKDKKYLEILMKMPEWKYTLYREILFKCVLFSGFGRTMSTLVANEFEPVQFVDGQTIVNVGERSEDLFVIIEGSAEMTGNSDEDDRVQYNKFDYFGKAVSKTIIGSIIARGPVLCAKLSYKSYGKKKPESNNPLYTKNLLKCVMFSGFGRTMCKLVADEYEAVQFENGQTIVNVDQTSEDLFIIIEGSAEMTANSDEGERVQYNKLDYFGKAVSKTTTGSIIAHGPVICAKLSSEFYRKDVTLRTAILYGELFSECPLLSGLCRAMCKLIEDKFERVQFVNGQTIVNGYETSEDLFIIITGSAEMTNSSYKVERVQYKKFDHFGKAVSTTIIGSIIALGPVLCAKLSSEHCQKDVALRKAILCGELLSECPLLSGIDRSMCKLLTDKLNFVRFADGQTIVNVNETSKDIFIIIKGSAEMTDNEDTKLQYNKFDYFGKAVSKTIIGSIIARGPVLCAKLSYENYRKEKALRNAIDYGEILSECPLLSGLDQSMCRLVADKFERVKFNDGQTIVNVDETSKDLFIIIEGSAEMTNSSEDDARVQYYKFDYFGKAVSKNIVGSIIAHGPVVCAKLSSEYCQKDVALRKSILYGELLSECQLLRGLGRTTCKHVAGKFERVQFVDGQTIVNMDDTSNDIFIIIEGSAEMTDSSDEDARVQFNKFDFFGKAVSTTIIGSIIARGSVLCAHLRSVYFRQNRIGIDN